MKTIVLGLGNPILSDDSAGIKAAEGIRTRLPDAVGVDVRVVCVGGLRLMEEMIGYDRVILIDSYLSKAESPGTIHRLSLDDLRALTPTEHSFSPHDASLAIAYDMGLRMGLPLATDVTIYAIEVANVSDFSENLTPLVAKAVDEVTDMVLDELHSIT